MNRNIRNFVLHNSFLRELFFILKGKKVNCKKIDKKIQRFKVYSDECSVLNDVIISLTSYGDRLSELQYTLYSLVKQTVKPEKIIVNLSSTDMNKITPILLSFQKYGVEFRETEDTKSYKKLIPTLQRYPNKIIVTADDDLFYPKDWLKKLWLNHLLFPQDIICHITAKITYKDKKINPYNEWIFNKKETPSSFSNLILSGGGTLFPVKSLYKDACKKDLFLKLSPNADDIWDYFMALLNGTKIKQIPNSYVNVKYTNPYREYGLLGEGETLAQINVGENQNDRQFKAVMEYYHISEVDFINKLCEK